MEKLLDIFFWRDPYTGKRRPRHLFLATVLALVSLALVWGMVIMWIANRPAAVAPTNTPLPPTNTPPPTATFTPSPVPTATPVPVTKVDKLLEEINNCEKDPANWTLTDQHQWQWKVLSEPKCALTGLSQAVAWHIATRSMGYTADEAAQALGYPEGQWPWAPSRTWWTMFATAGKWGWGPVTIYFLPSAREWKVDAKGNLVGVTLTPHGCYRANSEENGRVVWWDKYGFPFTIGCFFYEDFNSDYTVWQLPSGAVGDEEDKPSRVAVLFAYSPESGWVYLGRINDKKMGSLLSEVNTENDYAVVQKNWGIPLWNTQWVTETWGLEPRPLPSDWQPGMGKDETFNAEWKDIVDSLLEWVKQNGFYTVQKP